MFKWLFNKLRRTPSLAAEANGKEAQALIKAGHRDIKYVIVNNERYKVL